MIPIFSWAFINKFVIQNWSMKQDGNHKMLKHSSFRRQSSYIVLVVLEGGHNQPTINLLMYIRCNNCLRKPSTMRYYSFRVASGSRTKTLTLWAINGYCKRKVVKMGHLAISLRRVAIQKIMTLLYEDSFEIGQQSIGRWTDVMETLFETLQRCVEVEKRASTTYEWSTVRMQVLLCKKKVGDLNHFIRGMQKHSFYSSGPSLILEKSSPFDPIKRKRKLKEGSSIGFQFHMEPFLKVQTLKIKRKLCFLGTQPKGQLPSDIHLC